MYAIIRRYTPKGTVNQQTVTDFKRRIETGFLPVVQEIRGFHGYYVLNAGNQGLVSFGVFEDKAGADESTRKSADFVKKDPLKDQLGSPEITEGELLISREAAIAR
jgi:hypothetical protein